MKLFNEYGTDHITVPDEYVTEYKKDTYRFNDKYAALDDRTKNDISRNMGPSMSRSWLANTLHKDGLINESGVRRKQNQRKSSQRSADKQRLARNELRKERLLRVLALEDKGVPITPVMDRIKNEEFDALLDAIEKIGE